MADDTLMRCNRCGRLMEGTTAYDGACACGGLIRAETMAERHARHIEEAKASGTPLQRSLFGGPSG